MSGEGGSTSALQEDFTQDLITIHTSHTISSQGEDGRDNGSIPAISVTGNVVGAIIFALLLLIVILVAALVLGLYCMWKRNKRRQNGTLEDIRAG